jgi:hypothetical protein
MSITILPINCTRLQRFVELRYWNLEDCQALLDWHLQHERRFRQGWNNNLSLINYDVVPAESGTTWSLLLYKLQHFDVSYALMIPFKFRIDSRELPRAYSTFARIRDEAIVYCRKTDRILTGTDRAPVIDGLISRIYLGFGWAQTSKTKEYPIHRYRLLTILDDPDCSLTKKQDVHHEDGITKIRSGSTSSVNDTISNLEALPRAIHRALHAKGLDTNWVEM